MAWLRRYHKCGIVWGDHMASPPSLHQRCTDVAQKAETVLFAVSYILEITNGKEVRARTLLSGGIFKTTDIGLPSRYPKTRIALLFHVRIDIFGKGRFFYCGEPTFVRVSKLIKEISLRLGGLKDTGKVRIVMK